MAAKGAVSKQIVTDKIIEMFPGAFIYGKELRIPMEEDGQTVEIKVALTCAKTNVGGDGVFVDNQGQASAFPDATPASTEPTAEEKENISKLMDRLGL